MNNGYAPNERRGGHYRACVCDGEPGDGTKGKAKEENIGKKYELILNPEFFLITFAFSSCQCAICAMRVIGLSFSFSNFINLTLFHHTAHTH